MPDFSDVLSHAHLFLGPAEAALRAKVAAAPDDPALRFRLAEVLRQRGDLDGARAELRAVVEAGGAPSAASAVLAALDGRPVPEGEGVRPAPFTSREGLLDAAERERLWRVVRTAPGGFTEFPVFSRDGPPRSDPSIRKAVRIVGEAFPAFADLVGARVGPLLREAWAGWGYEPFEQGAVQMNIAGHADGGFFKAHADRGPEGHMSWYRRATFLYYFHKRPRRFTGGDLLLIDTDLATQSHGPSYTRITPDDGRLLLFPSDFYHQVTPVAMESDDIEDARLAITGWIYERPRG